jgi:3-dehydroquinate synthase
MQTIKVETPSKAYDILVEWGGLSQIGDWISETISPCRAALLTDENVWRQHGEQVESSIHEAGFDLTVIVRPPGEGQKCMASVSEIYDSLVEGKLDRQSALIAFGGGVVGDLGGFVASTYLRGIPFIQVPTTLLAQVDSSVGGKVGVNHPMGKNLIGSFYQPEGVLIDPSVLASLPQADLIAGLAEVLKYGVIRDPDLWAYLGEHREKILNLSQDEIEHIIAVSCQIKADVVSEDEKEGGLRMILNYGHTIGHALEATGGYGSYRHGEVVAIGMVAAAMLSEKMELAPVGLAEKHQRLIGDYGLPVGCKVQNPDQILSVMYNDKKALRGKLRFILASEIGKVEITDEVTDELVMEVLGEFG